MVFPKNFLWGGATAAVQIEGGYLQGGKGLNVADIQICYERLSEKGNTNYTRALLDERLQDVRKIEKENFYPKHDAINFYHRYPEYIKLLADANFKAFRMSINWARIYPNANDMTPGEEGLLYYDKVFQTLLENGITPIVTLTHYDMPLYIVNDYQGWYGRKTIDLYVKFVTTCLHRYHKVVKHWIVINQVNLIFGESFSSLGMVMDEYDDFTAAKYQAVHHEFVASAKIVEVARTIDIDLKIGMMLADQMTYAESCDPENVAKAIQVNRMKDYFYSDVQLRGTYPGYAKKYFKDHHIEIRMEAEDEVLIKNNTMDFLAIAYYYSHCINTAGERVKSPYTQATKWGWTIDPIGIYNALAQYWDRYQVPMMIAENGVGVEETIGEDGCIHDDYRIEYQKGHIQEIAKLIEEGTDIFAYTMWSPFDIVSGNSCEMEKRYGLIYVDYDNEGKGSGKCVLKDSYHWYKKVIDSNGEIL